MHVRLLQLTDFRNYVHTEVPFSAGLNVVVGKNGHGKTNLLEAISFVGGFDFIRGITTSDTALVRDGATSAVIRCHTVTDTERTALIAAVIQTSGRNRITINSQTVPRKRELLDVLVVSVFSPSDLELVKGGPTGRRSWIDSAIIATRPASVVRSGDDLKRIIRQRNALLRQASGRLDESTATTLDVWDARLAETGDRVRKNRQELLESLSLRLSEDYERVAGRSGAVAAKYLSSWGDESLAEALKQSRHDDVRRAVSTVGPHRDDIMLLIDGRPARTHASQGEQRCLALALRLAVDAEVRKQRGVGPVLLLDDVFSELDATRAAALMKVLPEGQCILTTTAEVPADFQPDQIVRVTSGSVSVKS